MHVPGWHAATEELRRDGRLVMAGIVQEQHPDRARLFMQWKQMEWPLGFDPLNLLEVPYVPITLGIDEHGVIRKIFSFGVASDLESEFLDVTHEDPEDASQLHPPLAKPDIDEEDPAPESAAGWRARGDGQVLLGLSNPEHLDHAIDAYARALEIEPDHGYTLFRLGVAHRLRYDSDRMRAGDFGAAAQSWIAALDTDPNNYIWRRRLQQYGPRLDKPYPFYDWVVQARVEIEARGETPVPLAVEPRGSEFAAPVNRFEVAEKSGSSPDPEGKVHRDEGFVAVETTAIPPDLTPGTLARVHAVFRPAAMRDAHWNNEVGELVLWIEPPPGWHVDRRQLTVPNPPEPASTEPRVLEFEIRCADDAEPGPVAIPAYAVYYVCEGVNGTCLYRRQDFEIELSVESPAD